MCKFFVFVVDSSCVNVLCQFCVIFFYTASAPWILFLTTKAPLMDVYLQWVIDAWESRSPEAIFKSFKGWSFTVWNLFLFWKFFFSDCGITICHDGSQDDQVHCFKEHGPISEGQFELMEERYSKKHLDEVEEVDKDEDQESGYHSDKSLQFENDNAYVLVFTSSTFTLFDCL